MPAAAGAELLDRPLLCCVPSSLSASIGDGRGPPELFLGPPPTSFTGAAAGAAAAFAAPPPPAISGAGLLGALLSKNVLILPSSSAATDSMILCLPSSWLLCTQTDTLCNQALHRASQYLI